MNQRMKALERANTVRFARAQLKRDLKSGRTNVSRALCEPDLDTMPVEELLRACPGLGIKRIKRLLNHCGVSYGAQCAALTDRQKRSLILHLHDQHPHIWKVWAERNGIE